jgi:hypothetical protein
VITKVKEVEDLERQGWTRQFTVEAWRVEEYVELYQSLGFETRVEPATPAELGEECAECYLAQCENFRTIYTRPAQPGWDETSP